jgi:hypothetical protein
MAQVAALVEPGWEALLKQDYQQLATLMRLNFRLRRQLYGDAVLGPTKLKMIQVGWGFSLFASCTAGGRAAGRHYVVLAVAGSACRARCLRCFTGWRR